METAASLPVMFAPAPFYERFGMARRAGFSLVEIGGWTHLNLSRVTEELGKNSLRLAAMTGAEQYSLLDPGAREEFLEYLSQSVAVAKSFGCRNLVIQSGDRGVEPVAPPAGPAESADFTGRAAAVQTLMEAVDQARRAGVTLFLKPAPLGPGRPLAYLHTNSSAGSLVKVINSPSLRLLFTFSPSQPADAAAAATFLKYREYIGHVHIEDVEPGGAKAVLDGVPGVAGTVGLLLRTSGDGEACVRTAREMFEQH